MALTLRVPALGESIREATLGDAHPLVARSRADVERVRLARAQR